MWSELCSCCSWVARRARSAAVVRVARKLAETAVARCCSGCPTPAQPCHGAYTIKSNESSSVECMVEHTDTIQRIATNDSACKGPCHGTYNK